MSCGTIVNKTVKRKYTALVHGHIPHDKGTIDAPIGRDPKDRQKQTVVIMEKMRLPISK